MKCQFCERHVPGVIRLCLYTSRGIWVCEECYKAIDSHRHKPYLEVTDRSALLEAGYYVNRKLARS